MDSGLFSAASGMIARTLIQDVVGRNIANASTTGYKRERVINADFANVLTKTRALHPELRMKSGTYISDIVTDFSQGKIHETGRPLDLSIDGKGFFVVQGPNNEPYYTRDGSFQIGSNGQLVTKEGLPVLGTDGPIVLPGDTATTSLDKALSISEDGSVYTFAGDPPVKQLVGRLKIVAFEQENSLERLGAGFYADFNGSAGSIQATGLIRQNTLEKPNFDIVQSMVEMLKNHRYYETGQKVISTIDQSFKSLFSVVG